MPKHDDSNWRKAFGQILEGVFAEYALDYREFCKQYHCTEAAFRSWKSGSRFPHQEFIPKIQKFLYENIPEHFERQSNTKQQICDFMCANNAEGQYLSLLNSCQNNAVFIGEAIAFFRNVAKHKILLSQQTGPVVSASGHIKAVVFDFDGTLTKDNVGKTTWESLWVSLGYTVQDCQSLHRKFDRNEISHAEWCQLTEEKFKERSLHRETVEQIVAKMHLLKGVRRTFRELRKRDIKIYIVSGSILLVVQTALGNLCQYVDRIQANQFIFNEAGFLTQIIGTQYDFEGKSKFIKEVAHELNVSTQDVLFIGNSSNDRFAYQSGAKTLCINPKTTDPSNTEVWNGCIQSCDDLYDIIDYIKQVQNK